jgi:hypothetical protein
LRDVHGCLTVLMSPRSKEKIMSTRYVKPPVLVLPPLDFMQPELLDEDRAAWPGVTFTIDRRVGPSGHTTVRVSGQPAALVKWLFEYCDEDEDLIVSMLDAARVKVTR